MRLFLRICKRKTRSLWVKVRHPPCNKSCPLYPQKQTCEVHAGMSALGHKRTFLIQTISRFFDHLIGSIQTPLSLDYENEILRLTGTDSLEAALASTRVRP